jgi:hypothetical protein
VVKKKASGRKSVASEIYRPTEEISTNGSEGFDLFSRGRLGK